MAAKKERSVIAPEILAAYDELIVHHMDAECKGATVPYKSINGYTTPCLDKTGPLALRLPVEAISGFLTTYNRPMVLYKKSMWWFRPVF